MTLLAYKYTLLCAFGNMMGSVFQYGYALGVMNSLRFIFFLLFLILTISIMLRDNLEAVYLQSDDMGGISFTTGRMIHKICFITMNHKYDLSCMTHIYSDVADTSVVGNRWRCWFPNWWLLGSQTWTKRNSYRE